MIPLPPKKAKLSVYSLVVSLYTLAAFHLPFFRHAFANIGSGFNAVMIVIMGLVLLIGLNYMVVYLLVWLLRGVGRWIVAFFLCGNAIALYFVNNYQALLTDEMMGNAVNTQYSEASGFFSFAFILYILILGVLPSIYVIKRKVDRGSFGRLMGRVGITVAAMLAAAFGNMSNWPWVDRNSTELGALLMPWSYIVNTVRYYQGERAKNQKEIPFPDPTSISPEKNICVLIIGESARRDRFSYYGYERETNPYTRPDGVSAFVADASATYTMAGVKAILEPIDSPELNEILPNYLFRNGADVQWRTSNWGQPPLHIDKYFNNSDLAKLHPDADAKYDGILLEGLKEDIEASGADKIFVVLHMYTNHGPAYNTNYPPQFEVFTPVCNTVEMSRTSKEELDNAYDNSIVYSDYLMHSVIEIVRSFPDYRSCVMFVSDHGESLGENNLYMHGVPMSMAPREQIEIPFLVWTSDSSALKTLDKVGQHHVFHSVLRFMGIETPGYNEELCIFAPVN